MSVSMLLGESGRVGNRHFETKGLRNESLFCYTYQLILIPPMCVSMLLGESGRVGNRHFTTKGLRNESLIFRICLPVNS